MRSSTHTKVSANVEKMASHYCDSLSETARNRLHQKIDGANEGVPKDIGKIADSMYEWEGGVAEALGLTKVDVASIKNEQRDKLELQS